MDNGRCTLSLRDFLDVLVTSESNIKDSDVIELSGMSEQNMNLFTDYWVNFDADKRITILKKLTELAEHNLDVDFDAIFKFGLYDDNPEIRCISIDGLWECEDRSFLDSLCSMLENDVSAQVRTSAALGIGKFATVCENGKMLCPRPSCVSTYYADFIFLLIGIVMFYLTDIQRFWKKVKLN